MKIAYDPQIFCAQTYGGISRYFCELAPRLAQYRDAEISIISPMHINAYLPQIPGHMAYGFAAPNLKCLRWPARGAGLLMGDALLRAIAPDIIHETYYSPYPFGPKRTRRVLTIYDMIDEKFGAEFPRARKLSRYKALAAARADHVICISESTRRDVIDILKLPAGKTSVIHLASGLQKQPAALPLPVQVPFLLYVGRRDGYKNFLGLLKAYAASERLREYALVCFGGGAFCAGELETMRDLGVNRDKVIQLEGNDRLLAGLYSHARAYICPSLCEGFGLPLLEAMTYECPVLCGGTAAVREVTSEAGEYFDPSDSEDMRAVIERVAESDSCRAALVANGIERAKYFSWERCAAQTLDLYRRLM